MISPRAIHLLIRHFDSIDEVVAKRMTRKRPWSEPALTSFLCDLLDEQTQHEENLHYPLAQLNQDLYDLDGILNVTFAVQTHEYDSNIERWVTQADIGLVINFIDNMLPENSRRASWLLQAKRLYPDQRNPVTYSEASRFRGFDSDQHERIEKLVELVGVPFVRYLLYCPRPSYLDPVVERKLSHLRNLKLTGAIFDYTLGLELHEALSQRNSSIAAGIFVAQSDDVPHTLGDVHGSIFQLCSPFSWFLVSQITPNALHFQQYSRSSSSRIGGSSPEEEWAYGIVTGEGDAVERLVEQLEGEDDTPNTFAFLPAHSITVDVVVGHDLDENIRNIRRG